MIIRVEKRPVFVHKVDAFKPVIKLERREVSYTTLPFLGGDKFFKYLQLSPADEWEINHMLGKFPAISIVDDDYNVIVGDVTYVDENKAIARFARPVTGKAFCN